ncbi:protein-S-isoprenylcysteine O-methyltransferase Ste14 [Kitasatospora sp. MAP12-15]|uniref:methyltransferase family protein n=1 Tax=unclassified Kitasatospora TaxID=2633591 RepID=UPI0024738E4F|nr:isoprenylcysteine carboxylmethyltransferase family protein [Kitasatospora sp. MAP12-44]MDH6108792.1 protein-S-isoprenylcysteine O-methyltransferase Ste14 [Kitasatospora sp. MAP12-44]
MSGIAAGGTGRPARAAGAGWLITPGLFTTGVVINLIALVLHGRHATTRPLELAATLLIAANLLWLLAETPISFRKPDRAPSEVATLLHYGLSRFATVAGALLVPTVWHRLSWWLLAPALLWVAGVLLRTVAIRHLGRFYSHHVIRRGEDAIVRSGPYRVIRHPAYLGMLLAHLGLVLCFLNWAGALLLVVLVVALTRRILVEERELSAIAAWRRYAEGRPRLIPGVW